MGERRRVGSREPTPISYAWPRTGRKWEERETLTLFSKLQPSGVHLLSSEAAMDKALPAERDERKKEKGAGFSGDQDGGGGSQWHMGDTLL